MTERKGSEISGKSREPAARKTGRRPSRPVRPERHQVDPRPGEEARQAAETGRAELQSIFDSSPNAIIIADLQGNIRSCNRAAVDVLRCAREQIVGKNFLAFVAAQDHPRVREDMQRILVQGSLKNVQYSALRADGSPFVVDVSTGVIRGDEGQATALVTIATDVTEREWGKASRRLSHEILEISNQHALREPMLRQIILAIQEFTQCQAVGVRILDKKGNIPYEAYTGFSPEFYKRESPLSIHNDRCMCINVIEGRTAPSLPFYTARGSFFMNDTTRFLATVSEDDKGRTRNVCNEMGFESVALIPIRSNNDILGLIHLADSREHRVPLSLVEALENVAMQLGVVLRRAMAEEALRKSEERFRAIVNNAAAMVAVVDTEGRWVHVNQYMLDVLGYSYEELAQIRGDDILHPEDRLRTKEARERLLRGEMQQHRVEVRQVRKNGEIIWVDLSVSALHDEQGRVEAMLGVGFNITEQKKAVEALAESEERYRLLFDEMLSGLALHEVIFDASGAPVNYRFLSVNAAFERMTGLRAGEILGKTVLEVMPGIERSWIARYGRVAMTGEPIRFEDFTQALNRHFDVRAYCPRRGQFAVVFHDITEQKQAEQRAEQRQAELLHVSRLSTLGEMASGLAHELNQPLSAIMSFASASLRSVRKNDFDIQRLATNLDHIVTQSNRAGNIIRRVRDFAQRRQPKFESVDVNENVREVLGLLHSNIRYAGVEVILELSEDLPPIFGDTIQLEQVLVNLMRNAIEAMEGVDPQRRRLTVRTFAQSRDSVMVAVSDTGPGMDANAMSHAFDPFVTTKENGLGIGLSISRSIIESHRGHLSVAPGPDCGCEFTFTLPASQSGVREGPAEPGTG